MDSSFDYGLEVGGNGVDPELSWQPKALDVSQEAFSAEHGLSLFAQLQKQALGNTYSCLHPLCNFGSWDPYALDFHISAAHPDIPDVYNIPKLIEAAHAFQHRASHPTATVNPNTRAQNHETGNLGNAFLSSPVGSTVCTYPGCNQVFTRNADLERHMKKHQDGPKEFGCPVPGCDRLGVNGFDRRDKLADHLKSRKHRDFFVADA